jgi:hypothetical protein
LRSHQNRKGAEVGFATETRRSNLRGISEAKNERAGRARVPATPLLMPKGCYVGITVRKNTPNNFPNHISLSLVRSKMRGDQEKMSSALTIHDRHFGAQRTLRHAKETTKFLRSGVVC